MSKNEMTNEAIYDASSLGTSKMLILGIQHLFAMFGATVLVPAITGLNVSTTLFFAGLGTLLLLGSVILCLFSLNARPRVTVCSCKLI